MKTNAGDYCLFGVFY